MTSTVKVDTVQANSATKVTVNDALVVNETLEVTGATTLTGAATANTFASSGATITGGTITGITDLTVADGGTGVSTLADGGLLVGAAAAAIEVVAAGATTEILVGGGAATNPVWTTATGTGAPVRAGSPTLTGTPAAPTASVDTNTTQIATTAFVIGQAATQAQQETGTSVVNLVTPGRQQFHPSALKGWCQANVDGTAAVSYNVTSITDTGTGDLSVVWATDFSGVAYPAVATPLYDSGGSAATTLTSTINLTSQSGTVTRVITVRVSDGVATDPNGVMVMAAGDQ